MNSRWSDLKEKLANSEREYDLEMIFCEIMGETCRHKSRNASIFTDLYNWYCCGIEDGMYQFFEIEKRQADSMADLGFVIHKYLGENSYDCFQKCITKLMPLVYDKNHDSNTINEISDSIDGFFADNRMDILIGIKNYLLKEGDKIAEEMDW